MSPLLIMLLVIVTAGFMFERVLDYLNLSSLVSKLPQEAEGIYDEEKYRRSQEYFRANNRFSLVSSTFSFIILLILLLSGGFGYLDTYLRTYTQQPVLLCLLYFGVLGMASEIIMLPFGIYHTFVIEEKFGFNKTSIKVFILDKIKSYILAIIIGGGLISGLVLIYQSTGEYFWILAWLTLTLLLVFASMFYTSLLLPIFNKLSPLPEGELRSAIEKYCSKEGFQLKNIFVMDGSKRSSKANAFFSGLGRKKKIVLYDTLIMKHSTEELVAILAHETGHYKLHHTRKGLILGILQTGIMFFMLSLILGNDVLANSMGAASSSFHIDIIVFGILYSPVSTILGIVSNIFSRKHEFEADAFARKTYEAKYLIEALKKLSSDNLSNLLPHPAYVFVHYSHPPLLSRLLALGK